MTFDSTDIFVGGLAILLGCIAVVSALTNWDTSFRLPKARKIEAKFGRGTARLFYAVLGLGLIALGAGIIAGFGPNAG